MSLRRKLFLILITLTTIPIFTLGVVLTFLSVGYQLKSIKDTEQSLASQVAVQSDILLRHVDQQVRLLAHQINLLALPPEDLKIILTGFMSFEGNIEQISILDQDGNEITRVTQSRVVIDDSSTNQDTDSAFLNPLFTHKTYYSPIMISEATNEPLVIVAVPIFDQRSGDTLGVVILHTKMVAVWDLIESTSAKTGREVFITTGDGQIVAHPNRSVVLRNEKYAASFTDNFVKGRNGETSIIGTASFDAGNQKFIVYVLQPAQQEYGKLLSSITVVATTIGITSLLVLILALQLGESISDPIIKLAKYAQSLEAGNFEQSLNITSKDEVGMLATAFNHMAVRIKKNINTLTALQDATNSIIHELDMDRVLQAIMKQVVELLGVESCFLFMVELDESCLKMYLGTGINAKYIGITLALGEGLSGKVWQSGHPMYLENYETWHGRSDKFDSTPFHSVAAAPLAEANKVLGVLGINYVEPDDKISEDDLQLLEKFAHLASIALTNARLFKLAQDEINERKKAEQNVLQQLNKLKALRNIDISITSSFNMHIALKTVLKELVLQVNLDAASIIIFDSSLKSFDDSEFIGFRTNSFQQPGFNKQAGLANYTAQQRKKIFIEDIKSEAYLQVNELEKKEEFVSYYGFPIFIKGELKGVLGAYHRSIKKLDTNNLEFLETLSTQTAIAIDNHMMFGNLQQTNKNLQIAYETTLEGWSAAMDLRDKETEGHTLRVTELTIKLALAMNIQDSDLLHIRRGALLHDIGKMGIPDRILLKPGALTPDEREIIEQHPIYAYNLLAPIPYLKLALDIPYNHHEKWDGSGYPRGLKGENIPFAARLFAVVDVFDALTTDRPYRKGWDTQHALDYIKAESGKHFDPQVVNAFTDLIKTMHIGQDPDQSENLY